MERKPPVQQVHFVSLGCPKNRVDTELMVGLSCENGAAITEDPYDADTVVVNTCAFLESATQESIDTIVELAELKRTGRCKKLIVTGCMVQRYSDELIAALPEVDLFLGTNEFTRISDALTMELPERTYLSKGSHLYAAGAPRYPVTAGSSTYLKVAEGCNRSCSFCIIPEIRGPQVSRPVNDLLKEAEDLADRGIFELNLIAQDLTAYGSDLERQPNLEELLVALDKVTGLGWIRLMYCYPWNFTDGLIEILSRSERVISYVDIPLQHINERILRSMRRNIQREAQARLIDKLRAVDGMILRTTLITGYPGETDQEFRELYDWVVDVEFDHVGVFTFSAEQGTKAAELPDQIPESDKEARRQELMTAQNSISLARNGDLVGRRLEVLVDGLSQEHELILEGRYYGQAPEIDGSVYLSFDSESPAAEPGQLVEVVIEQATAYDLTGVVGKILRP